MAVPADFELRKRAVTGKGHGMDRHRVSYILLPYNEPFLGHPLRRLLRGWGTTSTRELNFYKTPTLVHSLQISKNTINEPDGTSLCTHTRSAMGE